MRAEGLSFSGGGEEDILVAREAERAGVEMDLRFLKEIVSLFLVVGMGRSMFMVIARWSEMLRLRLERWGMVRPVEQTKSRM